MAKKMACAAAVLAAGALTAAVTAPTAAAAANKSCVQPAPNVTQCSTDGSVSLNARPNPTTAANSYGNNYMQNFLMYGTG